MMKLEDFVKTLVQPGQPLSAQLWNDNVEALAELVTLALAADTFSLRVTVQGAADPAAVRVTAVDQATHLAFEAVRPVFPDKDHLFAALKPGTYELRAEAQGFKPATDAVTIAPAAQPQTKTLTLAPSGALMPDLFGAKLRDALKALSTAGINVSRVVDVTGKDEPWANPSQDAADAAVLAQLPPAGERMAAGDTAHLVIAVVPKPMVMVEVPVLTGLTEADARKLLESKGLKLGTVTVAQKRTPGSTGSFDTADFVPQDINL
ncbi:MAG TPA: PASTA domain-containing protein [Thermoanaerobaculia bacterium]|jgi:hypothetical protein|nr:PASTA domain-containing protein [Thermoanaerobaculia bacterium]